MPTSRDLRLRIRSVKNLAQVTKALETVSASRVRRAIQANQATEPYAEKAWKVLLHLARQPGRSSLHPLLTERPEVHRALVVMVSSDRGLAGAYNMNVLRHALRISQQVRCPVDYAVIGRKGRELLLRRGQHVMADFSDLPSPPSFQDVAPIGQLVMSEFEEGRVDQVFLAYTDFKSMLKQEPTSLELLPISVNWQEDEKKASLNSTHSTRAVFLYEPDQDEILSAIIPRFIALQIFQAILTSQASEHAARMIAMHNATDSANELVNSLLIDFNKQRQNMITNEMLDIAGGANAQSGGKRGG
ncbi:MAG TPA: ATP synthase F1 subunit gamma [Anaerolinea sp.]|nr:ATP synthase F1 subunit gamma [Anaerolinea sp.]